MLLVCRKGSCAVVYVQCQALGGSLCFATHRALSPIPPLTSTALESESESFVKGNAGFSFLILGMPAVWNDKGLTRRRVQRVRPGKTLLTLQDIVFDIAPQSTAFEDSISGAH